MPKGVPGKCGRRRVRQIQFQLEGRTTWADRLAISSRRIDAEVPAREFAGRRGMSGDKEIKGSIDDPAAEKQNPKYLQCSSHFVEPKTKRASMMHGFPKAPLGVVRLRSETVNPRRPIPAITRVGDSVVRIQERERGIRPTQNRDCWSAVD